MAVEGEWGGKRLGTLRVSKTKREFAIPNSFDHVLCYITMIRRNLCWKTRNRNRNEGELCPIEGKPGISGPISPARVTRMDGPLLLRELFKQYPKRIILDEVVMTLGGTALRAGFPRRGSPPRGQESPPSARGQPSGARTLTLKPREGDPEQDFVFCYFL